MKRRRDPTWRFRLALGRKVIRDKTKYSRRTKHKPRSSRRGSSRQGLPTGPNMPGRDRPLPLCGNAQARGGAAEIGNILSFASGILPFLGLALPLGRTHCPLEIRGDESDREHDDEKA